MTKFCRSQFLHFLLICLAPPGGVHDKILKCDEKCDEMTELRNYENTDGTTDIGDYVNIILDCSPSFPDL